MPKLPDPDTISPHWQTTDGVSARLFLGDVITVLERLPIKSVQCCVTSPPYWGLRSYNTGDAKHLELGSERTPEEFVANMVRVFRAVRRVLRDDGVLWLNLGDTYCAGNNRNGLDGSLGGVGRKPNNPNLGEFSSGLAPGNLVGIPWRVALALQADGWVLRSDLPWVKRSAMPESVTNRPAKALEYVFLLTKSESYFFDIEAIKVSGKGGWISDSFLPNSEKDKSEESGRTAVAGASRANRSPDKIKKGTGRSFRNTDIWFQSIEGPHGLCGAGDEMVGLDVTSEAYAGSHCATFGSKLITPLILAGTSEKGCCRKCGDPWQRVERVERVERPKLECGNMDSRGVTRTTVGLVQARKNGISSRETIGWEPTCRHTDDNWKPLPTIPCTVLDPFVGSGTTVSTALRLGRRGWGIDLSKEYLEDQAIVRVQKELIELGRNDQASLEVKAVKRGKVPL